MADDDSRESEKEPVNYVRKKNLIPGWDNDHVIIGGLLLLGGLVSAPYVKQIIDNALRQVQSQMPHNGAALPAQQAVYNPPQTQQPQPEQQVVQQPSQEQLNAMQQHERALQEQKAYEAAQEKENMTGSQGINMVPDRSTNVSAPKKKGIFEAGSNISGSYS